jgi:gliding motility-associated-like protein
MDSVRVRVHQHLWVPDAFSPNGDGLNDTWQLTGIEAYPQARLTVYNRWGQAVYQSVGYDRPFDGTDSGKSLPTGAYSYVLHPAPNSPSVKGSVLLVR